MLWSRSDRDARRQKVLDELLEMDAEHRRRRLDLAVASGEVHSDEMMATMQLVTRLDALRLMSVPAGGRLPGARNSVHPAPVAVAVAEGEGASGLGENLVALEIALPAESASVSSSVLTDEGGPSISWLRP